MRSQLENRLDELKTELEKGQSMLADLKTREAKLRESMLRIQGAIQVLEEELSRDIPATNSKEDLETKKNGA